MSAGVWLPMGDGSPLWWSVSELRAAYRLGILSPVDVAREALDRIDSYDADLHAFVTVTRKLLLGQAAAAEAEYRRGAERPLLGIPVSIKDVFDVEGVVTTYGSLVHRQRVAIGDSGVVSRLRAAGAMFTGKTNTAEFGQSATTDNLLGPDTANPWDTGRTPGGSSGGAAASVASGMSTAAAGSDGGGSIRIPAAFTGLVGLKPTSGLCRDEHGFRAMTDFVSPGPLARTTADVRLMLEVLADRPFPPQGPPRGLRIGWCPRPEGRPVDAQVDLAVTRLAFALEELGHHVEEADLPLGGWRDIFGPLVLADEYAERGHLLATPELLTHYERRSLEAAHVLDPDDVVRARAALPGYRSRITALFERFDVLLLPTVAVPPFMLGQRPGEIDGEAVDSLWGAFPFAVPFNVVGTPAISIPAGIVEGLPVGAQLVGAYGGEPVLLDLCEQIEQAFAVDLAAVRDRWPTERGAETR